MDNLVAIPVLSIYRRLLVSLQGDVSDSQMEELTRTVLKRIHETNAEGLVIDTSGIWMMDSHMCAVLGRLAAAARLMGARPVLSGLSPSIVMTLQTMGIDLSGVETALGVEEALETLGLEVYERRNDDADDDLDLGSEEEDGGDAPSDAVDR